MDSHCPRLSVFVVALLALLVGACEGEVDWEEGGEASQQIRSVIASEVTGTLEVEVEKLENNQQRIDITVTGAPTDRIDVQSLAASDTVEQALKNRAMAIARALHTSYEHADRIDHVEVSFMKATELGPIGVSAGHEFRFDGAELEKL